MEYSEIIFELVKRIEKTKDALSIDSLCIEVIEYLFKLKKEKYDELDIRTIY